MSLYLIRTALGFDVFEELEDADRNPAACEDSPAYSDRYSPSRCCTNTKESQSWPNPPTDSCASNRERNRGSYTHATRR